MPMITPVSHEEERQAYAEFASRHAEERYSTLLAELYTTWQEYNDQFFDGQLAKPHLAIGRTAPCSLGHCSRTTDYGGRLQIVFNAGLLFGTKPDWVVRPWPSAEGTKRFIDDLLLRLVVRQYVLEILNLEE